MRKTREARIYRGTSRNVAFLAGRLRAGEIVAVPTETVYGLAGNALDAHACARIFEAKGRPAHDPLIVHIHSPRQLEVICEANDAAHRLAQEFWPGPLTLILPKKDSIPDIVTAGRNSVAVRMPSHPLLRRLLKATGLPLAAPSANPFGYISPTTAEHVRSGLGTKIAYILNGGPARIGVESTILDIRDPQKPTVLRPGAITAQELQRVLGRRVVTSARGHGAGAPLAEAQIAPGQLARHYSPRTPLVLHKTFRRMPGDGNEAFVRLRRPPGTLPPNVFWFDMRGNLRGVARQLFATLRQLDAMRFSRIHVELAPEHGLGHAINDRLRRAAAR